MLIAAIQCKANKRDPAGSQTRLLGLCEEAAQRGAALIVCPEMAMSGYLFADAADVRRVAEPATGPSFQLLAALSARHGCTIVCGYPEVVPSDTGDRLYNSAWLIGPDGTLLYNYRKRLLFDADETWAQPGDTAYPQLRLPWGSLTAGICMDLNDDRFTEFLVHEAASVVAFCTNWLEEGHDLHGYWRYRLLGVRSIFVAANTYGDERCAGHSPTRFAGQSVILDAKGRPLAIAPSQGDAVITAEVQLNP